MADHQQQQQQHQSSSPSTTSSQSTLSAGGGGGVGINPGAAHGHGLGTAVPNSNSNSSVRSQTHQTMQNKQQHSLHLQSATSAAATTASSQSQQIQQPQQFTQHYNIPPGTINGPRTVVLNRHNGDFGFTLRHFIVYPPESCTEPSIAGRLAAVGALNFAQPMDTVFVKTVHRQTPAYFAGLQEGDRLLAVNGMAVAGTDYAHVVATIQQTPKTLTLEVVPKNFDILQTFFSETAHNPETNQRFQPQSQFSHLPIQLSRLSQQQQQLQQQQQVQHSQQSHNSIQPHKHLRNVTEKQESLYSTLQDIATGGVVVGATLDQQQTKHLKKQQTSQKGPPPQPPQRFIFNNTNINKNNNNNNINNDSLSLNSTDSNNTSTTISASTISTIPIATDRSTAMVPDQMQMISGDSAIITRLRKSFEQKEEFLRRPSQPLTQPIVAAVQQPPAPQQREFYSRPNRLQKATWPPPLVLTGVPLTNASGMQQHEMHGPPPMSPIIESNVKTSNNSLREHNQMTREQFFNSTIDSTAATKPVQLQQQQQQVSTKNDENSIIDEYHRQQQQKQSNTLRIVSERTKQFESGRPLSPDGIVVDRTSLYKSELSRLSNKQAVPNVALRKREFELKAENSSWRRSSDEKGRSSSIESESRRTSNRTRSLSAESSKERFTTTNEDIINYRRDKVNETPDYEYLKPTRENSYLTAVRNSSAFWLQGRSNDLLISQILENQSTQQNKENLSYDQMKDKKLMHRNQIIVEVHNQNSNSNDENNMMYGNYDGGCNNDGSDISEMILSSKKFGCADDDDDIEMKYYEKSRRYISSMNQSHQQSSQQQQPPNNQLYPQQMQQKPPHHQMPPPPIRPTTLNLTDSNNVVLRKKHHHHNLEEDDRPMRRVSYLRATANDNAFNIDSDIDSSPLSQPPDTPDTEDTNPSYPHHILKSAYRPWSRPRLTTDIQPLRRFFDDSPSAPIYLSSINENVPNCMDSFSPQHHQQQLPSTSSLSSTSQFLSSMLSATITTTTSMSAIIPPTSPTTTSSTPATTPTQISSSLYFHLPTSSVVATKNFFTQSHGTKLKSLSYFRDSPADSKYTIAREGELNVKVTIIDGKRSHDRSWRQVHAELRGNRLKLTLVRDGKNTNHSPEPSSIIDLTNFHVAEGNYTKRKHVFKITSSHPNPSSSQSNVQTNTLKGYERELLLQADSNNDMKLWMESLRNVCRSNQSLCSTNDFIINNLSSGSGSATTTNSNAINNNNSPQSAEPQRIAAVASVQSSGSIITSSNDEFSPILSTKSHRSKYSLGGSRSPSGQSPVTKSRKTPHSDSSDKEQSTGSPKSKTWKGIVARQLRKIQGSPGVNQTEILPLEGASIGVPLHLCPPSEEDEYVPLILTKCTSIVESKGLHVVGIYRIPGNTAAISCLTERVNRGLDEQTLKDPKWDDVNVVSSLLKCFIRSLPEPLLPNEMYNSFINADKLSGNERLIELKNLLDRLPHYYYETLKHLIRHLNCISKNCVVNLMEPRNLAIVFGPSVVRSANETLETAVKDMRHQCQIVEALVSHYTYFFENDPLPKLLEKDLHALADSSLETPSTSLLLDNVSKIEPFRESSRDSSTRFVANIVQAANRKIRRTAQRISVPSSATPDSQSLDSTTSAESKEQLKLRFFNDDTQKENQIASEPQPITPSRLSNDSNDCVFSDTDTGSMSLTTVTIALDNKLRSLRNSSIDSDKDLVLSESAANTTTPTTVGAATSTTIAHDTSNYKSQLLLHRPLTLGENIPFADESPERPLRAKPVRHTYNSSSGGGSTANNSNLNLNNFSTKLDAAVEQLQQTVLQNALQTTKTMGIENSSASDVVDNKDINSTSSSASTSSDDTDTSTTSNPREKISSAIRLDTDVLREVNRILTNLERKANNLERKFSLNRSLSLNYKNHKNNECCCLLNNMQNYHGGSKINNLNYNMNNNNNNTNNNNNANNNSNNNNNNINNSRSRLLLTKNEKTDKNINKRRQIQDINNSTSSSCSSNTSSNNSCNNIIANNNNNNNNNNNANNKLATSSSYHHRRNIGINNRSIRRRHTVGGTHDYFNTNKSLTNHHNNINYCQNYLNTNYNNDKLTKEDVVVNDGVKNDN